MLRSLIIAGMVIGLMSSVAMAGHKRSSSRISFSIGFSTGTHFRHSHSHFHYGHASFGHLPRSYYHRHYHHPHHVYHRPVYHRPAPVVVVRPAPVVVYEQPVIVRERPVVVYERPVVVREPVVVYERPRYSSSYEYVERSRRIVASQGAVASSHVGTTYQAPPAYSHRGGPRYEYERRTTYHYGY